MNTRKIIKACPHAAITHFSCLIVNVAAAVTLVGRHLVLNTVIPTCFYAIFWLKKRECSGSFESERFTMLVAGVVYRSEKFDKCRCANKWEWVSVNGSWIGLVSWSEMEKAGGTFETPFVCTCGFQNNFLIIFNCCATPNSDILFRMMKITTKEEDQLSWK